MPELLAQANRDFDAEKWPEAEKAFLRHAKEAKDKPDMLRSTFRAGLCRVKTGNEDGALSLFGEITGNAFAAKIAPDVTGDAFDQSHLIYTRQRKTVNRARAVSDCSHALPGSLVAGRICEREADTHLCEKSLAKALDFYRKAGAGLSPCGTNILSLLSLPKAGEMNAPPLSERDAKALSVVLAEREDCGLVLCDTLSKAKDGWRAQDVLAQLYDAKDQHHEAVAIWDALAKSRQGPAEAFALASADTLARSGRSSDAVARYAAWLNAYPDSKRREQASAKYTFALWSACRFAEAIKVGEAFLAAYPNSLYRESVQNTVEQARADLKGEQERAQLAEEKKKDATPLRNALEKAERNAEHGRHTDALRDFLLFRGQQAHPLWGRAWYGYGRTALALGEMDKALVAWDEVIRHAAMFTNTLCAAESRRARADLFLDGLTEPAKALADYLALRDLTPPEKRPDRALEQRIGMALLALGKGQEAKPIFSLLRTGEAEDPVRALYWDRLITLCDNPSRAAKASVPNRRAYALKEIADIQFTAEQWQTAAIVYRKALNEGIKGEDAAWCEMQRARCLAYNGDFKGALAVYDRFKADYRKSAWASDALLRAGILCAGPMDNPAKAIRYFKDILEICPDGRRAEDALLHLASLTWWSEDWQEADRLHRAFLKKYPDTPLKEEFEAFRLPLIAKRKTPFSDPPEKPAQ